MFSCISSAERDLRTAAYPWEEGDLALKVRSPLLGTLHAYPRESSMTIDRLARVMKLSAVNRFLALNH
jgi:hypothetical protein